MKTLVINLCQMGDLIQATPLFHDLKSRGAEVTLLVRQDQEETARHLPNLDTIIALDMAVLQRHLQNPDWGGLEQGYRLLIEELRPVLRERYDMLFNLTHTRLGALLAEVCQAKDKRGLLAPDGTNPWISGRAVRYLRQMLSHRSRNNIHVVDLHRTLLEEPLSRGHLEFRVTPEEEAKAEGLLREHGVTQAELLVGMQPGATEIRKRWPVQSFCELASLLIDQVDCRVLVFGVDSERSLAREIALRFPTRIANLAGKTDLGVLAALLSRCRVLVSNDTGTSHLAASVGTPVLTLHLGHVTFSETGPYGSGHLSVQPRIDCGPCSPRTDCHYFRCHDIITPWSVHRILDNMLNGTGLPQQEAFKGMDIVVSEWDAQHFLTHASVINRPDGPEDHLRNHYGTLWKSYLTRTPMDQIRAPVPAVASGVNLEKQTEAVYLDRLTDLMRTIEEATEVSRTLIHASRKSGDKRRISLLADRFKSLHAKILEIGAQDMRIKPLTSFYEIEQENIRAATLPQVMKSFESLLQVTHRLAKNLQSLILTGIAVHL